MTPSGACKALAKESEGFALEAYPDEASPLGQVCAAARLPVTQYRSIANWQSFSGAPWTVGWGHTEGVSPGDKITVVEAETHLDADLCEAAFHVLSLVMVPMTQGQFDALVDFVFNLGWHRLALATLLHKLNKRDFDGAAAEFPKWCHEGERVLPGLLKRRMAEQAMFLRG